MTVAGVLIAVVAGLVIGFSMGAVGGGGAILAVPVLIYGLGQSPVQASTASVVVVAVTAVAGLIAARRDDTIRWGQGLVFAALSSVGAVAGATTAARVPQRVLLLSFAAVMVVVAALMVARVVRGRAEPVERPAMVTWRPFTADWTRVAQLLGTALAVGVMTGFLGVGGGFMIVPALTLLLGMGIKPASSTSLVVLLVTSGSALATRLLDPSHAGHSPDWTPVALIIGCAVIGSVVGTRVSRRADARHLALGFTVLVCGVAVYTATRALVG